MVSRRPGTGNLHLCCGSPARQKADSGEFYFAVHGVGSHFEPSASFRNCELTVNGC